MSLLAQDTRLTRRVGAATMFVLLLSIVFVVFIYDRIEWGEYTRLKVYFRSTGGLQEGAAFVVAGKVVGRVETISLVPHGAKSPLNGEEGIAATVAIESAWARRVDASGDVFITANGTLAPRFLEIGPAKQPTRPLREGDELTGREPPSMDRVLQRMWDNLMVAKAFGEAVRPDLNALRAEVDALQATMAEIAPDIAFRADVMLLVDEGKRTYEALGGEQGLDRMSAMLDRASATITQARATIAKLRTSIDGFSAGLGALRGRVSDKGAEAMARISSAVDRIRAAIDKIDPLLAQVEAIQGAISRGEGSLLKLMNDPEFPEDAKDLGKVLKRQPWKIIDRPQK